MNIEITRCPSLLIPGHATYSPKANKILFDGIPVSHIIPAASPSSGNRSDINAARNIGRLSLSGAQSKIGAVIDGTNLRFSGNYEQSTHILKPRPTGYHIICREYCAANENLTMQLASQIYGIETAPNGLCFFSDGEAAYVTKRFDVRSDGAKMRRRISHRSWACQEPTADRILSTLTEVTKNVPKLSVVM